VDRLLGYQKTPAASRKPTLSPRYLRPDLPAVDRGSATHLLPVIFFSCPVVENRVPCYSKRDKHGNAPEILRFGLSIGLTMPSPAEKAVRYWIYDS